MLLAQITDTHIVEAGHRLYDRVDTAAMLAAAVDHVNTMSPRPDLVLATGDLVNDGHPAQYEELARILADLAPPLVAIPGNHDDRANLQAALPQATAFVHWGPDGPGDALAGVVDDMPLRLVGLDTTIPGQHRGLLGPEQLTWLDRTLAAGADRPTLVFQHHPPFATGIAWMERSALADRAAEAEVISGHRQVVGVVCGHLHRLISAPFAGTIASTWPSTGAQLALALDGTANGYCDEPPAIALHRWTADDGLVSHVSYVGGPPAWLPPWAENG